MLGLWTLSLAWSDDPDTHLSVWQQVWLLEPLLWASEVPAALWEWVDPMIDNHSSAMLPSPRSSSTSDSRSDLGHENRVSL